MDEKEYYMKAVEDWGRYIFLLLWLISFLGVVFHVWLSHRLSFFDFETGGTNKKGFKRIVVPLIFVAVSCGFLPIIISGFVQDVYNCIHDPWNATYVSEYASGWKLFVPVSSWFEAIIWCALLGMLFYFILGFITRLFGSLIIK